jgi:hypothetical protein
MAADGPMTAMTAVLAPRSSTGDLRPVRAVALQQASVHPTKNILEARATQRSAARTTAAAQSAPPLLAPAVLPTMVSAQG